MYLLYILAGVLPETSLDVKSGASWRAERHQEKSWLRFHPCREGESRGHIQKGGCWPVRRGSSDHTARLGALSACSQISLHIFSSLCSVPACASASNLISLCSGQLEQRPLHLSVPVRRTRSSPGHFWCSPGDSWRLSGFGAWQGPLSLSQHSPSGPVVLPVFVVCWGSFP